MWRPDSGLRTVGGSQVHRSDAACRSLCDSQVREELAAQGGSGSGLYTVDRELMARLQPDAIVTQVGRRGWGLG